jgi:hypothetical protein
MAQHRKEPRGISRREFLKGAGLVVGGAAFGAPALLSSCNEGAAEKLVIVLNPEGQPPPILMSSMAPRLDTIIGKKIYLIDIHFTGTQIFLEELQKALTEKYGGTEFILKVKAGAYAENDQALWDEVKKNGDAVIMGIGH